MGEVAANADRELRALFAARLTPHEKYVSDPNPPARGDYDLNPAMREAAPLAGALRAAAVLVPIVERNDGPHMLLTRRTDDLPTHAGQVAFPGGRVDDGDADAVAAALRETAEETGIGSDFVSIAGLLDPYETGSGFSILPVVGFLKQGFVPQPNAREVAEIFEVPFAFLMDPRNHQRHSTEWRGQRREYYAMPYGRHYIWGATAGMIVNLYQRLYL